MATSQEKRDKTIKDEETGVIIHCIWSPTLDSGRKWLSRVLHGLAAAAAALGRQEETIQTRAYKCPE